MVRVASFLKRLLFFAYRRSVGKLLLLISYQIGGLLLVYSGTRQKLNSIYNRLSPKQALWFCKVFDRAPIWLDFIWISKVNGKALSVPVRKGLLRSWCNARHWKWFEATSRGTDLFYRFMIENAAPSVMFDIGANDGMHAYKFALHGFQCVCFEPQQTCVEYIHRVCQLNAFDDVRVEQCIVSDKEDQVDFYTSKSTWYSSVDRCHTEKLEPVTKQSVRAITLDEYCRSENLIPKLIKIDVEGHEINVIKGAMEIIRHYRPHMVVEIWPGSESKKGIWCILRECSYIFIGDDGVVLESLEQFMTSQNLDYLLLPDARLSTMFLESLRKSGLRPQHWTTNLNNS